MTLLNIIKPNLRATVRGGSVDNRMSIIREYGLGCNPRPLKTASDFCRRKVKAMRSRTKILLAVAVVLVVALSALGALMVFNKSPDLLDSEFRVIVTGSMDGEPQTQYEDTNFDIENRRLNTKTPTSISRPFP